MTTAGETPLGPEEKARFLLAAISDIQGSVRANDSKAQAALVVHGLLFAGVVSAVTKVGPHLYEQSATGWRVAAWVTLGAAGVAFFISVMYLVTALVPRAAGARTEYAKDNQSWKPPEVFFPPIAGQHATDQPKQSTLWDGVDGLSAAGVVRDLTYELWKVQSVRHYYAMHAKEGFYWLRITVGATAAFLIVLLVAATSSSS
jgi:hypothetical protein